MQCPPQSLTSTADGGRARCWRLLRLTVIGVAVALMLGGCVVRVVYNQLDWLALWYVEDYFKLDSAQEAQAEQLISRTLTWHRQTQLPRYASLARTVLADLQLPATPGVLAERYAEVEALWDVLLRRVVPDVASLLRSLSDAQAEELFANLADENRELAEDYSGIGRDERRAKQDKAIIRAFRRFTGRLSPGQEVLVHTHAARFHDLSADWLARRESWQEEFHLLMVGRTSDPLFADRVIDLMLNPDQFDSPDYRQRVFENQQSAFRLVAAILDSLSPQQLERLRDNLTTYASDFDALGSKPGQKPGVTP